MPLVNLIIKIFSQTQNWNISLASLNTKLTVTVIISKSNSYFTGFIDFSQINTYKSCTLVL